MTEPQPELIFTRAEFYELLWTEPTTRIAQRLGCSDVLLGKICQTYEIPKPYPGYWAQKQAGKTPARLPLPESADPEIQQLRFAGRVGMADETQPADREAAYDADIQALLKKARDLGPIIVSETLRQPHRYLVATKEAQEAAKRLQKIPYSQRSSFVTEERRPILSIDVTEKEQKRAYRIMDAFLKRFEAVGGVIVIQQPERIREHSVTKLVIGTETVTQLRLREKFDQKKIFNPRAQFEWERHRTELVASGRLLLDDGPGFVPKQLAIDTKTKPLELKLSELLLKLLQELGERRLRERTRAAEAQRLAEAERARQRLAEERRRRQEQFERAKKAEGEKLEQLIVQAQAWQQSQLIRNFLYELGERYQAEAGSLPIRSEVADYLRWGFQQADRIDPLEQTPPSILDQTFQDAAQLENASRPTKQ